MVRALKKNPVLIYDFKKEQFFAAQRVTNAITKSKDISSEHVFLFLVPTQLEFSSHKIFTLIFTLLKPGGRFYAISSSRYALSSFIPDYEKRCQENVPFPGYITQISDYLEKSIQEKKQLPDVLLLVDPTILKHIFEDAGFTIIECTFVPSEQASLSSNQKQQVLLIVEKP